VSKPPDWPFRCPIEGWYLSNVEALSFTRVSKYWIPDKVVGMCKQHGQVTVKDARAYSPTLWSTVEKL
jgi:hypothetical protein